MLTKITATVASVMVATSVNALEIELTEQQVRESATIYANAACEVYTEFPYAAARSIQTNRYNRTQVQRYIALKAGLEHTRVFVDANLMAKYRPIAQETFNLIMSRCEPFVTNYMR